MCKLFALTSTANIDRAAFTSLLRSLRTRFVTVGQKDGFGYAVQTSEGLASEKFVSPSDFESPFALAQSTDMFGALLPFVHSWGYEAQGARLYNPDVLLTGPLIVHGRTATNDVDITNTHPFIKNGFALAHNGVVEKRRGNRHETVTTCDSEHLLNAYAYGTGASDYAKLVRGYFATIAINPSGNLVVVKDVITDLFVSWSTKWQCYGFSTDAAVFSMLKESGGFTHPFALDPYVELELNGANVISALNIAHPTAVTLDQFTARRSLGKTVTQTTQSTTAQTQTSQTPPSIANVTVTPTSGTDQQDMKDRTVYNSVAQIVEVYGADEENYPAHVWARWCTLKHAEEYQAHNDTVVT